MIGEWMERYPQFDTIKGDIDFEEVPVVFYFENKAGSGELQWIASGLGALMLGAIWLFPEAKGTKD